jgi:hypothetical protein
MPAIADLVATLEVDHADALMKIGVLTAANATLADALNAVTAEKAALEARVTELSARADSMLAMAEKVATGALDMLRAARLPADTPPDVVPFAPKPKTTAAASMFAGPFIYDEMLKPAVQVEVSDDGPRRVHLGPPKSAAVPINEPTSVADRLKQRFLPAVSFTRRPDVVEQADPGGLPMFLRRDTVFRKAAA